MLRIVGADPVHFPAREKTRRHMLSFTWTLVAAFVVGVPAAYLPSPEPDPASHTAEGTLWVVGDPGVGLVRPC